MEDVGDPLRLGQVTVSLKYLPAVDRGGDLNGREFHNT
jgi:hypothetical protein